MDCALHIVDLNGDVNGGTSFQIPCKSLTGDREMADEGISVRNQGFPLIEAYWKSVIEGPGFKICYRMKAFGHLERQSAVYWKKNFHCLRSIGIAFVGRDRNHGHANRIW